MLGRRLCFASLANQPPPSAEVRRSTGLRGERGAAASGSGEAAARVRENPTMRPAWYFWRCLAAKETVVLMMMKGQKLRFENRAATVQLYLISRNYRRLYEANSRVLLSRNAHGVELVWSAGLGAGVPPHREQRGVVLGAI